MSKVIDRVVKTAEWVGMIKIAETWNEFATRKTVPNPNYTGKPGQKKEIKLTTLAKVDPEAYKELMDKWMEDVEKGTHSKEWVPWKIKTKFPSGGQGIEVKDAPEEEGEGEEEGDEKKDLEGKAEQKREDIKAKK